MSYNFFNESNIQKYNQLPNSRICLFLTHFFLFFLFDIKWRPAAFVTKMMIVGCKLFAKTDLWRENHGPDSRCSPTNSRLVPRNLMTDWRGAGQWPILAVMSCICPRARKIISKLTDVVHFVTKHP